MSLQNSNGVRINVATDSIYLAEGEAKPFSKDPIVSCHFSIHSQSTFQREMTMKELGLFSCIIRNRTS